MTLAQRSGLLTVILVAIGPGSKIAAQQQHDHHPSHETPSGLRYERPAATKSFNSPARTQLVSPEFSVTRTLRGPAGFVGTSAFHAAANRLFLISFGPPANTQGTSTLYELDPESGQVLARVGLPFLGETSAAAYFEGFLYVGVPHDGKIYKLLVSDRTQFGKIVSSVPVPRLNALKPQDDEPYRFPFLNFFGLTITPDHQLLIHAQDLGELVTLERETGKLLKRVKTVRALGGIVTVPGPRGEFLVLGNADPEAAALKNEMRRFMFRANHGITPPSMVRQDQNCQRPGARDIRWTLLDAGTGDVLAANTQYCTQSTAGGISLLGFEHVPATRYGRFRFLSSGEEGMFLTMDWTPSNDSFF